MHGQPVHEVGDGHDRDKVKSRREQRIGVRSAGLWTCLVHEDGGGRKIVVKFNLSYSGSDPSLKVKIFFGGVAVLRGDVEYALSLVAHPRCSPSLSVWFQITMPMAHLFVCLSVSDNCSFFFCDKLFKN